MALATKILKSGKGILHEVVQLVIRASTFTAGEETLIRVEIDRWDDFQDSGLTLLMTYIAVPPDEDEVIFARRLVAQRCLYGVDLNPVAVDLAKVSLWLVTLAKDHALTFVDHALRHGDSLVGLFPGGETYPGSQLLRDRAAG